MAEICISVAAKAAEYTVDPIATQLGYMWNYKTNFENLEKQLTKLEDARATVQRWVEEATRNAEEIEQKVVNWLDRVNKINEEATKIIEDNNRANMRCFKSLCPDLKMRYQHSKKAADKANDVSVLRNEGKFDRISYRNLPEETWHPSSKPFEDFESRTSTLMRVINALRNPDVHMVGVHGMGGIGKTTLAREVGRKTEESKIFDVVVFVEVSESPDIRTIQGVIADKLGLKFDREESVPGRANTLRERLKKETKILLILDNIWESLDLEKVGIPFNDDHRGCKLLLTARKANLLSDEMGCDCENNFPIGILKEEEAWDLFKKIAGSCVEGHDLQSLAFDVAKECGGLPIAIVTVAKALKNKEECEWKSALHELQHPSVESLEESVATKAYSCIKLSYNRLDTEELKSAFLLCCSMDCTYKASIEELLRYGVGLNLFKTIKTMEEGRYRVNTLVRKLKRSSLLLDTPDSEWFSIHDVVRDVGRAIAFKDHNKFIVIDDVIPREWKDINTMKNCTSISLHDITELPDKELDCPLLQFLYIKGKNEDSKIPDNFFKGMLNLRVLHLINMELSRHPPSLRCLVNLRTLCLNCSSLRDIGFTADMKDLEILVLSCKTTEQLQVEIGQLTQLRLLDLSECSKLEIVPQIWKQDSKVDVILQNIEELDVFRCNGLVTLIPPSACFKNLTILRVSICVGLLQLVSYSTAKSLVGLKEMSIGWCNMMTKVVADDEGAITEDEIINFSKLKSLQLDYLSRLTSFCSRNYTFRFPSLERLSVQNCPKMKIFASGDVITPMLQEIRLDNKVYVCEGGVNTTMRQIHEKLAISAERVSLSPRDIKMILQKFPEHQFSKLKSLEVFDDESTVFPFEMLQRSHNLEQLKLRDSSYKEIFLCEEVEKHAEILSQLKSLDLEKLHHLEHMWKQDSKLDLILHNLENLQVRECNSLIRLMPASASFQNLQTLKVWSCNGLISLVSSSTAKSLVRLEEMRIEFCNMLTDIVANEDVNEDNKVVGCNSLITPMPDSASFQNLKSLRVMKCDGLISLVSSSTAKSLVRLEEMSIEFCNMVTNIVATEDVQEDKIINFSKLRSLKLLCLPSLASFCSGNHTLNFPSLTSLFVRRCPKMKFFSSGVSSTPLLQRIEYDWDSDKYIWEGDLNTTVRIHEKLFMY